MTFHHITWSNSIEVHVATHNTYNLNHYARDTYTVKTTLIWWEERLTDNVWNIWCDLPLTDTIILVCN